MSASKTSLLSFSPHSFPLLSSPSTEFVPRYNLGTPLERFSTSRKAWNRPLSHGLSLNHFRLTRRPTYQNSVFCFLATYNS